jgi:hypothetical protein
MIVTKVPHKQAHQKWKRINIRSLKLRALYTECCAFIAMLSIIKLKLLGINQEDTNVKNTNITSVYDEY